MSRDLLWVVNVPASQETECLVKENNDWAGLEDPVIPLMIPRWWAITDIQTQNTGSLSSHFLCDINYFWSKPAPGIKSNYTAAPMDYVKQSGNKSCMVFVLI